ncbi:MAG: UDP-2,3-diacylglucosamine diphosphatase LpxI [Candidatus Omnitrophica bacterium]|nr:UDP-2,3-diacylglucosamine diphosphatase LpxI [Candidatus Omnitrophota bacterium]
MSESIQNLGLIAGNGKFPILFARAAKLKNIKVIAAGIKGDTAFYFPYLVDRFAWFSPGELKKLFAYFKGEGVRHVIMAGQVSPKNLFDDKVEMDDEFRGIFAALQDRKADTIFKAVAERLQANGMELLDSTLLLRDHLAPKGTLTKRAPTTAELEDIQFGFTIAKLMGGIDIGQTVVVKEKAIVAIEAMEGTDKAIFRGCSIARKGAVVVKTSKPKQDDRFDVPVIGPKTLKVMAQSNGGCLAIEAGKTLIIDLDETVRLADKAAICIVAA